MIAAFFILAIPTISILIIPVFILAIPLFLFIAQVVTCRLGVGYVVELLSIIRKKNGFYLRMVVASAILTLSTFLLIHFTFQFTRSIWSRSGIIAGSIFVFVSAAFFINRLFKNKGGDDRGIGFLLFDRLLCMELLSSKDFGKQEGFGMFGALAGFALAQGAALTAVAKGEGRDKLVLTIYLLAVIFTVAWNRTMLVTTKPSSKLDFSPNASSMPPFKPFFSETSVIFGVWTLAWNVILGATMFALG